MTDDNDSYLVWSNEHRAWWGPGENGYVLAARDAGRYSRGQAIEICRRALGTSLHIGVLAELPVRRRDVADFLAGSIVPADLV